MKPSRFEPLNIFMTGASNLAHDCLTILPLLKGEGSGEGEGDILISIEVVSPKCSQMVIPLFHAVEERDGERTGSLLQSAMIISPTRPNLLSPQRAGEAQNPPTITVKSCSTQNNKICAFT
jgi:hypothetical protein